MKFILVAAAIVAVLCAVNADAQEDSNDISKLSAKFSAIAHAQSDLHKFTNLQLEKSFDFLLLGFTFDKYDMDRPGFEKLYRKISDKAWEDTQKLIKYQGRRGLSVQLNGAQSEVLKTKLGKTVANLLESKELDSLKTALDYEKELAEKSHAMHKAISHAHEHGKYDPDVAHFLDEEIIEYQSGTIRKLAGYIHNLDSIIGDPNNKTQTWALGVHLFDEYLDKVE